MKTQAPGGAHTASTQRFAATKKKTLQRQDKAAETRTAATSALTPENLQWLVLFPQGGAARPPRIAWDTWPNRNKAIQHSSGGAQRGTHGCTDNATVADSSCDGVVRQQLADLARRLCGAEKEALHLGASLRTDGIELTLGLHALRRGAHTETCSHL